MHSTPYLPTTVAPFHAEPLQPATIGRSPRCWVRPYHPQAVRAEAVGCADFKEVTPWVAILEKLWDDPEFEAWHRDLARAEASQWDADRLVGSYEEFFSSMNCAS